MTAGAGRVLAFASPGEMDAAIPVAVEHVARDGVLGYPTETIYGLGGDLSAAAVAALGALKPREHKPFLVLIAGRDMLAALHLDVAGPASDLADRYWPGPLTLVLPAGDASPLVDRLRGPEGGIAVRWTSHAGLSRLIRARNAPLTSTSANRTGVPPAVSAQEIATEWDGAMSRGVLLVLDGGPLRPSAPSTVVDCTAARLRVIRPGAISASVLRETVPDLIGNV